MDISKAEMLKQHFATRVSHQARAVLDLWRCLHDDDWQQDRLEDLQVACEKLLKFSERFEAVQHVEVATALDSTIKALNPQAPPTSEQLKTLNDLMMRLSQTAMRSSDKGEQASQNISVKKPVYMALNDSGHAVQLAQQMEYFGLRPELFNTAIDYTDAMNKRLPMAIIMDIDFCQQGLGLELIHESQNLANGTLPVIFYNADSAPLETRLKCSRLGGIGIHTELDAQPIITQLESLLNVVPEQPFRILIVDDSRSQALFSEKALNAAGMITRVSLDPMEVLNALEEFQPEMVLMDMYMPGCTGMELAKVIRQDDRYINMPIIYLSGEEDRERQLAAMAEGGDDFLTKPVDPQHLLSTIRTRGNRARELTQLIVRDSLTGLYNHTHILKALEEELSKAKTQNTELCFVMVDIDHFKQVNDNYGHPMGDEVIKNLSLFLSQRLRKTDPIGRYGGEEFAIIMPSTNIQNAMVVMDEIRNNFEQLIHGGETNIKATFSTGIATFNGQSTSELIDQADQALYQAKDAGRNCVRSLP